jgi:hypothetical protein
MQVLVALMSAVPKEPVSGDEMVVKAKPRLLE